MKTEKTKFKIFKHGLFTGLLLQCVSIGPVSLYIINLALEKTILDGLIATFAVTLIDCSYIILTVFGLGKLLENKKIKKILGIISSFVLIFLGVFAIKSFFSTSSPIETVDVSSNLFFSFSSTLLLTAFNPLTIVFYTGIFSVKAIESNYQRNDLLIFGLSVGSATLVFLSSMVILLSLVKETIPLLMITILKIIIGCLLIIYGLIRLKSFASLKEKV